jgi:hypothetical protein
LSPGRVKNFLFCTFSGQAFGPIQPPAEWVPGRETDRSPPTGAEVKNTRIKHRDNFTDFDLRCSVWLFHGAISARPVVHVNGINKKRKGEEKEIVVIRSRLNANKM